MIRIVKENQMIFLSVLLKREVLLNILTNLKTLMVKNFLLQIEQIEPNCDHEQKSNILCKNE